MNLNEIIQVNERCGGKKIVFLFKINLYSSRYTRETFLSTTRDRNYALALVESGSNRLDEFKSVLFEINLDRDLSKMKPYADISRESAIQSEDEVLIMLGSVFRLKSVYSTFIVE